MQCAGSKMASGASFAKRTKRMTPNSPEMSFFSVVSFELSTYHKNIEEISSKIGYIRKERTDWR